MEATGIYWVQLYIILEENGFDVVVCNAKHIKNLGEKKTDYVDASWIQLLHTYGLLTESFQPENKIRELKFLNRHRDKLIESSNRSILRMQKALEMMNIKIHKVLSDIKGKSGLDILKAIVKGERRPEELLKLVNHRVKASKEELLKSLEGNWSDSQIIILKQNLDTYFHVQNQIKELDIEIEKMLKVYISILQKNKTESIKKKLIRAKKKMDTNNAPQFDIEKYSFQILGVNITRIPGISGSTSLKIISELGSDFVNKFPTVDKFCSWLNLVPNNKISGGKLLSSKLPKRTNYTGQVLRVAANTLKNHKGYLGDIFRAKKVRLGYNQAIVAVAHKIARIIYKMIKDQVEYDDMIEQNKNKNNIEKKIIYYQKKLLQTEKMLIAMS